MLKVEMLLRRVMTIRHMSAVIALLPATMLEFIPLEVDAESLVALTVIGNGSYQHGLLRNPLNDASDVTGTLEALGFAVELRTNADQRTMEEAARLRWTP